MRPRRIIVLAVSLALVGTPVLAQVAASQQTPPAADPGDSGTGYIVPIAIGVALGALAWPLAAPAVAITADNVVAGSVGAVAARGAAVPVATAWTWRSVLAMPAVVGGLVGGVLGYAVTR